MAVKGHGTTLKHGAADPADVLIGKVTDITPPNVEVDDIETTNMDSPDTAKEYEAGYLDGGEVEVTVQFVKATQTTVYGLIRTTKFWLIEFSDGSKWSFSGYLKGFANEVEREGIVSMGLTIKVSGKPTYTAAA